MQESKLTTEQITSMSEVVANYMGSELIEVNWRYGKLFSQLEWQDMSHYINELKYHSSWDWIHEVWEKVKLDENFKNTILYDPIVTLLAFGTKEQVFTAIYNAIKMRINIFPNDIESIDPRTELVNPYL